MLCASVASRTPALALTVILLRLSHQQDAKNLSAGRPLHTFVFSGNYWRTL